MGGDAMGHFQIQKSETWNENHFFAWNFLIFPNMVMSRLWRLYLNSATLKVCIQGERVTLERGYPSNRVKECSCLQIKFHRLVFPITRVNFTSLTDVFRQAWPYKTKINIPRKDRDLKIKSSSSLPLFFPSHSLDRTVEAESGSTESEYYLKFDKVNLSPLYSKHQNFNSVTNNYTNLDMEVYVKYLRLMFDSNLSWKYHTELICYKVSRSLGIIAKIRHYIPRRLLLQIYNSLIVPYLTYLDWGTALVTIDKRGLSVSSTLANQRKLPFRSF